MLLLFPFSNSHFYCAKHSHNHEFPYSVCLSFSSSLICIIFLLFNHISIYSFFYYLQTLHSLYCISSYYFFFPVVLHIFHHNLFPALPFSLLSSFHCCPSLHTILSSSFFWLYIPLRYLLPFLSPFLSSFYLILSHPYYNSVSLTVS